MLSHENFYIYKFKYNEIIIKCAPKGYEDENFPTNEACVYYKGKYIQNMPRTFVQSRGRALKRDIIYGGGFYLSLISEKLKTELEEAEVTGVEFIPIEIELKNGSKYSDYYAMIIHGRAKAADRNDSHPEWIEEEPQSMWRDVGYMFPLDSWDGSDIFCSEEGKAVVVSEKAQRIFAKYPECCELVRCDRHIYPLASKRCSKTEARNKNIIPNGDIQRNV